MVALHKYYFVFDHLSPLKDVSFKSAILRALFCYCVMLRISVGHKTDAVFSVTQLSRHGIWHLRSKDNQPPTQPARVKIKYTFNGNLFLKNGSVRHCCIGSYGSTFSSKVDCEKGYRFVICGSFLPSCSCFRTDKILYFIRQQNTFWLSI